IPITFTPFLPSPLIIITLINTTTHLYHILFPNLLPITHQSFSTTILITLLLILLIIIFYTPLIISTFHPTFSR
ncbi:metal ABC transporter permease, partial [Staphylococcus epidermidis]|uniref:metal ABC transporter permease n=1 Tax=Staphylococcus epidermidis TaxID=1282 RepID=UPI0016436479